MKKVLSNKMFLGGLIGATAILIILGFIALGYFIGVGKNNLPDQTGNNSETPNSNNQNIQNEETPTEIIHLTEEITPQLVLATMNMNLNCRYGPNQAFNIKITFLEEQTAIVLGRNEYSSWYQVSLPESSENCWVWSEGIDISGDLTSIEVVESPSLPQTETPTPNQIPNPNPTPTPNLTPTYCKDYLTKDACEQDSCIWADNPGICIEI